MVLVFASLAKAQTATPRNMHTAPSNPEHFPSLFYPEEKQPPVVEGPVMGAPFEARLTVTMSWKKANGDSQGKSESTSRTRDSVGRVRDQSMEMKQRMLGGTGKAYSVHVRDPIAHCQISWEEPRPTDGTAMAVFLCLPRVLAYTAPPGPLWDPSNMPEDTHSGGDEERARALPEQMIEGVRTIGIRSDTSVQAHGDQPAGHSTTEMRYSPELREMMLVEENSFDTGGQTMHMRTALTDLRRVEPDASKFYPPAGYELVDGRTKSNR